MIKYAFYPPDSSLTKHIFSYGTMELDQNITVPLVSPPNGLTGFLIRTHCSDCETNGEDFEEKPIANQAQYVIGQTTMPIVGNVRGRFKYIVIFFNPLGIFQLYGTKMSDLTDKTTELNDFLGLSKTKSLIEKLVATDTSIENQIDVLNTFFLQQEPFKTDTKIVSHALDLIHKAHGNITVNELLERCETSRRSLERHFQEKIGLSPKVYSQVFRFKCMMNYLEANPKTTWAELSNIVGYFDQAHLIRYFKEYLKVSPNNLVSLDVPFINYLLHY